MKKLTAILIAIVVAAMISASFAATMPEGGIKVLESADTSIIIYKELKAYNPSSDPVTVKAPTITYQYSIAPGSVGKGITDSATVNTSTLAGLDGATITESVSWTPAEQLTTAVDGYANRKPITVSFSGVTFTQAGVYRYVITETATYTNTGVTDGESHTRYLDVYVKNAATAGQYEIYGYVLFTTQNGAIDATADATNTNSDDNAVKTEGFVGTTADKYYTYNLSITKSLTDDAGMNSHEFPFTVSFAGNETGILPSIAKTGTATIPTWTNAGTMASFSCNNTIKIANGAIVTITGIPIKTSVTIKEYNNVPGTTYNVAFSGADNDDAANAKLTAPQEYSNTAQINEQTAGSAADKNIVFTNNLRTISPTGIILRYAPYMMMLIGGIALLIIAKKHKKHTDEEDN